MAKMKKTKSDFEDGTIFEEIPLPDTGGNYEPNLDPNPQGSYDPRLDPNPTGSYDPRLDPNLPPGQYDPRLDPGVPAPGNSYGGGGTVTLAPGGSSGGGGGSTGASLAQQLARLLTGGSGGDGSLGSTLAALLPLLAAGYGAYRQSNASSEAARLAQEGLAHASEQAQSTIGGAQANYSPFIDAGKAAAGRIGSMPLSNIAGNFKPIGSGKGLNLSQIIKG